MSIKDFFQKQEKFQIPNFWTIVYVTAEKKL